MELFATKNFGKPEALTIAGYKALGGFQGLDKALAMPQQAVIDEVKKASLRGRGGAGFPAGVKWGFLPKDNPKPRYLAVNADEGEPGTFKDRLLMEGDPFGFLEGTVISSYALNVHHAYVYVRGEFFKARRIVQDAVDALYKEGLLGKSVCGSGYELDVTVHPGAGAYICGEETALLESLEGKRGEPRIKPPFPAVVGAFGCPTIINNVETLAYVPWILAKGADWFAGYGIAGEGGPKLFCMSGDVKRPGLYELHSGANLRELIYEHCGGIVGDKKLLAVIPGGASSAPLTVDEIDVGMDFETLKKKGTMLGSAATMVIAEGRCVVKILARTLKFFHHESCGQCTPCREGTGWLHRLMERLEHGGEPDVIRKDMGLLFGICDNMVGNTICVLADAAVMPTKGFVNKFRGVFEAHMDGRGCPLHRDAQGHP
ncbi:MAG: NADH-quinone oxidoreductase subunit NuoF [Deltaproteobacteria bacterium]|nr:NADH-quinone oxidoreductase subunit NuoF [Deltaproteobacteria bacterium]